MPSSNALITPWAGTDPLMLCGARVEDESTSLSSPNSKMKCGLAPRAMDRSRGVHHSEAYDAMASGARNRKAFDESYSRHLSTLKGVGVGAALSSEQSTPDSLGRPSKGLQQGQQGPCSITPSKRSSRGGITPSSRSTNSHTTPSLRSNVRVLAPILSSPPVDARGPSDDNVTGGGGAFGASNVDSSITLQLNREGGKKVKGLGGMFYRGAVANSNPIKGFEGVMSASDDGGDGPFLHVTPLQSTSQGPYPDEITSRANRLHQTRRIIDRNRETAPNDAAGLGGLILNSSPREQKRLRHEEAVAEGIRNQGDIIGIIPGQQPDQGSPLPSPNRRNRNDASPPPNEKVAARLALIERLNTESSSAQRKTALSVPLAERKHQAWLLEQSEAKNGFSSPWKSDREGIAKPKFREEPLSALEIIGGRFSPACLPADDLNKSPPRVSRKGKAPIPASGMGNTLNSPPTGGDNNENPPSFHSFRQFRQRKGKATAMRIPPEIEPLTSDQGGRYFLAPEPVAFDFNNDRAIQQRELPQEGSKGAGVDRKKKGLAVGVSKRSGHYKVPSGGTSPAHPTTLSESTEKEVARRVQKLVDEGAQSLAKHKKLMQTVSEWERQR